MRKICNNLFLITAIFLIAGCGVPQEEHDALVLQMQTEKAELEANLNTKISELESIVKSEKAKVKSHRLEMDNAERKIKDLQTKNAQSVKDLAKTKSEITSLKRSLNRAEDARDRSEKKVSETESQLNSVQAEKDQLQFRFDQLVRNMNGEDTSEKVVSDNVDEFLEEIPGVEPVEDVTESIKEITAIVSEMNEAATTSILDESNEDSFSDEDEESSRSFFWFLGF